MKAIIPLVTSLLLLLNIVCGLILPHYDGWNIVMTSIVMIFNAVLIGVAVNILNDAFKISLSFIFSILCLIECLLSILSPQQIENNLCLLWICLLVVSQLIILISAKFCQR